MNIFSNGINYADGETPTVMTANIEAMGYEGWYYKNSGIGKKITWYIPLGDSPLLVSDLTMVYASLRLLNTASLPFLTIYTAPIGFNDAATWYHSKTVFSVPETVDLNENANYCFYAEIGAEVSEISIDGHINVKLTALSSGNYTGTNVIKYIAFCTAEDAAAGEVEFILSDINLLKSSGDIELFLSNGELFSSINVDINALVLSNNDVRESGTTLEYAFLNPLSVTKVVKIENSSLRIGHNGLINDTILNNFKLPRLANVAGKGDSSIAVDNTNTLFNNFYVSLDFAVETNVPSAQFTVEAWGLDCATRTKIFVDENGDIKIMYRGVDLFSKNNVLSGDIILDASSNPTEYGWTTHVFPGSLIPGNWYRLVQTIHFSDELYGDQVQTRLYELSAEDGNVIDIVLWDVVDNTWEAFYVNHPSQAINGNMPPSVDSIQIHCCDSPRNLDVVTIKNITYSTSKTVRVESIDELMPSSKGIVTFLAGNSTGKSIDAITGLQYLFEASGGYQMERGFNKITVRTQDLIQRFDVTDSVQVKLSAGLFNTKLGLVKDASNLNVITTTYSSTTGSFPTDSITITSSDFVNGMSASNIISVGKYSTMYSDFISYVRKYFGYSGGFSSLFQAASEFDISGGVFNADSFMALISSGKKIVADDVNVVDTAPSLYYKMTDVSGDVKLYENVAKDYTGTIFNGYGDKFENKITKWGAGTLNGKNNNYGQGGVASSKYIVPGITGMSFSFWVNVQDNQGNHNRLLFSLGNVFNVSVRNTFYIVPYIQCTNGGFATMFNYLTGSFIVGTWNYITITVDPAGIWKYYLNGAFKQSVSIASGNAFGYPSTTTALQLQFGYASGYYNEFLYYDRILSATEIINLYNMYMVNNGTTISSWVKFSSLDTTPRTIWSFYDTISKNTLSLAAKNTNYTLGVTGSFDGVINGAVVPTNANTYTISTLTYPYASINGTYIFSASFINPYGSYSPFNGFNGGNGSWRTPNGAYPGYLTQSPYSYDGNYIGGDSTEVFFTTEIDGLTISGEWWQMQLPSSMYITRYSMNPFSQRKAWPRGWYLAGSNNGTTWTQLDRRTNQNEYDYSQSSVWFNLPNPGSYYQYLRMVITNTQVSSYHSWIQGFSIGVIIPISITTNINEIPALNTWTHIATTLDNGQKNNTWTTYINNVPYYSDIDNNGNKLPYINLTNSVNAIGMDASSGLNKMHGYIDDLVIYKAVLSPVKIAYLYNGSDTLGKVADYTFDTNSLTNYSLANYASGSAVYDASITNLSLMTASGEKLGSGCLYFPNKTYPGSVKLGKMAFPEQREFSFSTWANFSSLDNSGSVSTVLSMYSANSYILLSATADKYTLAIKNTQAPVFIEALPIQNNDFTTSSATISGLGYPYCRNGSYLTSGTIGYEWRLLNRGPQSLYTPAVYSSSNGSYTGTNVSYVNSVSDQSNIPYGANAISGIVFQQSTNIFQTQWNMVGISITADGKRLVYSTGSLIYFRTYNSSTDTWDNATQTLETTTRGYTGLALTADGNRCVVGTTSFIYFCTWNGTNYSTLTQTLNTTIQGIYAVSLTADGSKLCGAVWNSITYSPLWAYWNGTNYSTFTETLDIKRRYASACISNDGTRIAYVLDGSNSVFWADWNGTNFGVGTLIPNATSMGTTSTIATFSSDKSKLFVAVVGSTNVSNIFYTTFNSSTSNYNNFIPIPNMPNTGTCWSLCCRDVTPNAFEVYANTAPYNTNVYKITGYDGGYGISGEYIQYKLPYKLNPTYFLMNANLDTTRMPKTFYILGSNNNSTWEIVLYKTNVAITGDNGLYSGKNFSYNISSSNYYNYFRIIAAQTNNLTTAIFYNLQLNGYAQESINYTMDCAVAPVVYNWNHIAGTLSHNGLNSTVKMYINNSPYTFTTDSSSVLFPAFGVDASYTNIAVGMDASGSLNKMVGYIDDTKFYNASLSDAQISSLYNNQSIFETILGKYNFNTETVVNGQIANYASGSPVYDMTITNTSLVSSTGQRSGSGALFFPSTSYTGSVRIGNLIYDTNTINVTRNGALWNYKFDVSQNAGGYIYDSTSGNFNMSNTYVNTLNSISSAQTAVTGGKSLKSNAGTTAVYYGGNPIYTIPADAAMTFAFWIYIDSNVSNNGKGVLGMANSGGTSVISVKVSGTTTYNLSLQTIFNGTTTTNIPSETITPATWTYVCWNISTTGVWKFYINGVLKQTINANVKPFFSATNLFAASAYGAAGFYGYLDEYRYYERELTAAEISSQYNYYTIAPNATVTNDLSGSITISNINNLLRHAVDANVFGNRTPNVDPQGSSVDPSYNSNYGVGDGFLDGDIIWVPAGTTIKLSVGIDSESFLPINNIGPATSADLRMSQDTNFGTGNFSQATSASVTKISRTLKAPLMIRVSNL